MASDLEVLEQARVDIAKCIGADFKEIYFTSGGSEADNQAIISAAKLGALRNKKHIISTKIEHHAVLHTVEYLEKRHGFEVTYLDVDEDGIVDLRQLEDSITDQTILITIMAANNEIGTIQPIEQIGEIAKAHNIPFHTDAVQAIGQVPIDVKKMNISMLSMSGHKIYGPKGIGVLYVKRGTKLDNFMLGGAQEHGRRAGTENVPGIAGMALAAEMIYSKFDEDINKMYELKEYFINEVTKIEGTTVNGLTGRESAPHVISVSFEDIPRSEVLLHALEEKGIYVSSGSACASNHPALSGTLQAIGIRKDLLSSTLRFSLSVFTTKEELDYTISALKTLLPVLRKYKPR